MGRVIMSVLALGAVGLVAACGGSAGDDGASGGTAGSAQGGSGGSAQGGTAGSAQGGTSGSAQGGTGGSAGSSQGGTGGGGEWVDLISGDWSLPDGEEGYTCVLATVPEDISISAFRAVAPVGTHHTVLTLEDSSAADGVFPCNVAVNGPNMIYGSGVGTEPLHFPPGVAINLKQGDRLLLNLHLFNVGATTLTGRSGVEVQRVDPSEVEHEAELLLAGKDQGLVVDTGETTQTGHCTMPTDVTVFAVSPHMHQLGVHMKVSALLPGGNQVLMDAPYSFDDQRYYVQEPLVSVPGGSRIQVDCTYYNDRGETVTFGDSSLMEMCYAGVYRYPKVGTPFITCTN